MVADGKDGLDDPGAIVERWARELDWRASVLAAAERRGTRVHIVGGAIRDLLLGARPGDVDLVVEGDATALALELDAAASVHDRFGTARAELGGSRLDLATARTETYPAPGALPVVRDATIEADLDRRDFTVNTIAAPLDDPAHLIDPHGGLVDLANARLEILHEGSIRDDPTRALRAARYAARLGFRLSGLARDRIAEAELETVSGDRIDAELATILSERAPVAALRLLADWGLLAGDLDRLGDLVELAGSSPWTGRVAPMPAALEAGEIRCGPAVHRIPDRSRRLARLGEGPASSLARAARGASIAELAIAAVLGAEWPRTYVGEWSHLRAEIGGEDLLAAGIEPGPAIGLGLEAALAARLDGEADSRDEQLEIALAAARRAAP